jgi:3-phosphoglycerate kinase
MIKSIEKINVENRRVIVRVGFDVPLEKHIQSEDLIVADDLRIRDALSTLKYLIKSRAKVILISHLGRPKGREQEKSMWPTAVKLSELLGLKIVRIDERLPDYKVNQLYFLQSDIEQKDYSELSSKIKFGDILFLENLRFYKGEEENSDAFVNILGKFGDIYVNEAFSVAHRKAASTYGLPKIMQGFAGTSFIKEVDNLSKIIKNPPKPMVVIMGGAKLDDKIQVIEYLAKNTDKFLVGGGIANSFLKAQGYEIGKSICGDISSAKELYRNYRNKIVLPLDVVVAKDENSSPRLSEVHKVLPSEIIYDVGPRTIREYAGFIKDAKCIVWNGPFGKFEIKRYAFGSRNIAELLAQRGRKHAYILVGGGETNEIINSINAGMFVDHQSMGGGAMLEFLAGKKLPAVEVLDI